MSHLRHLRYHRILAAVAVCAFVVGFGLAGSFSGAQEAVGTQGRAAQGAPARPSALTVLSRAGRQTIPIVTHNNAEMIGLEELAATFQLTVREDRLTGGLTVSTPKGKTIVLGQQQGLASVDGKIVSLPGPPVRTSRGWLVPLDFITRALAPVSAPKIDFRRASGLIVVGDLRVPRVAVRHEPPQADRAAIVIDITPRAGHTVSQEGRRLVVRFEADALDTAITPPPATAFVQNVRTGDDGRSVVIDLGPQFGVYKASDTPIEPNTTRLLIDVLPPSTMTGTQPAPPVAPVPQEPSPLLPDAPMSSLRTIVLDPGHGGTEEGAKGPAGTLEKDLTLQVARRLKAVLEARLGVRVVLTRDSDRTVGLDERAAIANNNKADLFISLHANASVRSSASGAEVFYLSLGDYGQEALEIAEAEGASLPALGGGTREIDVILWEMAQARHIQDSAWLSNAVERRLRARVPMSPRAIQQAPFRVLVGANMPAVLVEMGFITNPEDEQKLRSEPFQREIVQALYESVVEFRDYLDAGRRAETTTAAVPAPSGPSAAPGLQP